MISIFDGIRAVSFSSVFWRMFFAALCGGIIGIERSYKNRSAGFRTHILVALAASIAAMTGIYLYLDAKVPADISRLGAQVVSGLGFIGAGTIIVTKQYTVRGLTTAAGLWTSGIIGLACGAGFYEGALTATALMMITQTLFAYLEKHIRHSKDFQLLLTYQKKEALDSVMRYCKDNRLSISNLSVAVSTDTEYSEYTAVLTIRPKYRYDHAQLIRYIKSLPGVYDVEEMLLDDENMVKSV